MTYYIRHYIDVLVSSVVIKGVGKEITTIPLWFPLSGDVEVVLISVNRVLNECHTNESLAMLTVMHLIWWKYQYYFIRSDWGVTISLFR